MFDLTNLRPWLVNVRITMVHPDVRAVKNHLFTLNMDVKINVTCRMKQILPNSNAKMVASALIPTISQHMNLDNTAYARFNMEVSFTFRLMIST